MAVTLRRIREEDLEMIMQWRMDPDITKYMNTNPKLTLDQQKLWLHNISEREDVLYWLVEQDQVPVGVINLLDIDWANKTSSWGYYIGEKNKRSLKLAISLEMSLYDYVFDILDFKELHNEVFSLNVGVIKLHLACGSHIVKEVKEEIEKEGIRYDIVHLSITTDEWNQIRHDKKYERINFDIEFVPHHIGYAVADISKAISMYKKLGYHQASEVYDDIDRNVRIVFMEHSKAGYRIELVSPLSEISPISDTLRKGKNLSVPYHICYEVGAMEETIMAMKKRGYILTKAPAPAIAFQNRRVAFLLNKDAGLVELVERG